MTGEGVSVESSCRSTVLTYIIHRGVAENAAMAGHGARASKFQLDIKSVLDFWVSAGQFWAA